MQKLKDDNIKFLDLQFTGLFGRLHHTTMDARIDEIVSATLKGRVKVLESISLRVRSKQVLVRFLKPIESFVGVDMNKYGPFQQEDVASLPLENARSIVESGVAVHVHASP